MIKREITIHKFIFVVCDDSWGKSKQQISANVITGNWKRILNFDISDRGFPLFKLTTIQNTKMPEKTSCLMSSIINDDKMDTATEEKKIPNLTKVSKIWC